MLSSEPSVIHNLFASGGSEILQELPKCDTETESEQMLLGKWYELTYSVQGGHKPSTWKKHCICEAQSRKTQ